MQLLKVHELVIACSILACILFAAWSAVAAAQGGGPAQVAVAIAAGAAALGLAIYLRAFRRRTRSAGSGLAREAHAGDRQGPAPRPPG